MNKRKRFSRLQLIAIVALLTVFVAGCTNVRRGVAWPDLELVTINDQTRVLITYNDRIEAIDPYQGAQLHVLRDSDGEVLRGENGNALEWKIELKLGNNNETFYVSPFIDGDNFIFPTYDNRFVEVDIESARLLSEDGIPLTDGIISDVIVTDDLIYVPYRLGDVVALDRETYAEIWRFETDGGVWTAPLLYDGVLYISSINHFLYAVDAETGNAVWNEPVDLAGAIASTPLIYNDSLYVGSYSHKMYQISLDGVITNEYEGNSWIWGTPVIVDEILYFTDLNGYVYALNANDLSEIWAVRPARRGIRPAPLVTDNFVVVAARDGTVHWLNRETGTQVQEVEIDNRPELLSDILYLPADEEAGLPELILVASTDNGVLLTALNMETFSVQWVYKR